VYNAAHLSGVDIKPAHIIHYIESHGGALINGKLGMNPMVIVPLLKAYGLKSSTYALPDNVDARIKNSGVSILLFAHDHGAHYVTVQYRDGEYWVYNEHSWHIEEHNHPSIDEWAIKAGHTILSITTLP